VAGIWGQTRSLDGRTFDRAGLPKRRLIGRGRLRQPDMGTDTMSGITDMGTDTMSDIPIRNVQRETFSSQLSTG